LKLYVRIGAYFLFILPALAGIVWASEDSLTTQFLGSPLLILVALILIDAIAFAYHKIRK
jgi:hypothetical protein